MKRKYKSILLGTVRFLILACFLLAVLLPLYWLFITSFKTNLAMSKTPHTQYLCMFARHGNLFYHSKFIVTTSSKWYN